MKEEWGRRCDGLEKATTSFLSFFLFTCLTCFQFSLGVDWQESWEVDNEPTRSINVKKFGVRPYSISAVCFLAHIIGFSITITSTTLGYMTLNSWIPSWKCVGFKMYMCPTISLPSRLNLLFLLFLRNNSLSACVCVRVRACVSMCVPEIKNVGQMEWRVHKLPLTFTHSLTLFPLGKRERELRCIRQGILGESVVESRWRRRECCYKVWEVIPPEMHTSILCVGSNSGMEESLLSVCVCGVCRRICILNICSRSDGFSVEHKTQKTVQFHYFPLPILPFPHFPFSMTGLGTKESELCVCMG